MEFDTKHETRIVFPISSVRLFAAPLNWILEYIYWGGSAGDIESLLSKKGVTLGLLPCFRTLAEFVSASTLLHVGESGALKG